jgi:hypothetical protein
MSEPVHRYEALDRIPSSCTVLMRVHAVKRHQYSAYTVLHASLAGQPLFRGWRMRLATSVPVSESQGYRWSLRFHGFGFGYSLDAEGSIEALNFLIITS